MSAVSDKAPSANPPADPGPETPAPALSSAPTAPVILIVTAVEVTALPTTAYCACVVFDGVTALATFVAVLVALNRQIAPGPPFSAKPATSPTTTCPPPLASPVAAFFESCLPPP